MRERNKRSEDTNLDSTLLNYALCQYRTGNLMNEEKLIVVFYKSSVVLCWFDFYFFLCFCSENLLFKFYSNKTK